MLHESVILRAQQARARLVGQLSRRGGTNKFPYVAAVEPAEDSSANFSLPVLYGVLALWHRAYVASTRVDEARK